MKREIKFRGKDYAGEWHYGSLSVRRKSINGDTVEICAIFAIDDIGFSAVKPETVGQFTGITDKNGKEIYEGDIVLMTGNVNCGDAGTRKVRKLNIVEHKQSSPGGILSYLVLSEINGYIDGVHGKEYELIGNIHDNPDLLTTK
jgi:uncharacterized phage protein (TIGR01671 family)